MQSCNHSRTEFVMVMTGAVVVGCMSLVGVLFMLDVQSEHEQILAVLSQILAQVSRP
jgi:Tfp pilus assembly protein PilN